MKKIMSLLAGVILLTSFTTADNGDDEIDGLWLGYYKSDFSKEKLVVKFGTKDQMEFYAGGLNEPVKCIGSYKLLGDSISFRYITPEGDKIYMQGHVSRRRNYVEGEWKMSSTTKGSFFMEKQDVEEKTVEP